MCAHLLSHSFFLLTDRHFFAAVESSHHLQGEKEKHFVFHTVDNSHILLCFLVCTVSKSSKYVSRFSVPVLMLP